MESGRPLREAFAELLHDDGARDAYATDPDGFLGAYGHHDLPGSLVAEAIVSFADASPPEVAEHLAPFVQAHTGIGSAPYDAATDPGQPLELLASAPPGLGFADPADAGEFALDGTGLELDGAEPAGESMADLGFGAGATWQPAQLDRDPAGQDEPDQSVDGDATELTDFDEADAELPAHALELPVHEPPADADEPEKDGQVDGF